MGGASLAPPGRFRTSPERPVLTPADPAPLVCALPCRTPPPPTASLKPPTHTHTSVSNGTSSAAGMFCSQPGLSQPSGPCEAGYHCPPGSTSSNATEHQVSPSSESPPLRSGHEQTGDTGECSRLQSDSTRTRLCPSGHYCPSGVGYPLPCPVGTLSLHGGLGRVEECPPCPPGRYCDRPALAKLSDAPPCEAG